MRRSRTLDGRSAEALLSGRAVDGEPELVSFIAALSAQAVAVEPSAALAALLADGFVPDTVAAPLVIPRAPRAAVRRWALQASLGAAACVAVTVGAASNDLPAPVQRTVANVVEALTPLTVPRPVEDQSPTVTPPSNPTNDPATRAKPSHDPSEVAVEHESPRATERADNGERDTNGRDAQPDGTGSVESQTDGRDDHPATSSPRTADHATSPTPSPTEQPDGHESPSTDGHSGSGSGFDSGSGPSTEER